MPEPVVRRPVEALTEVGRRAWALLGVLLVLGVLGYLLQPVTLVVFAFLIALFPAALLSPAASWLKRHRVPGGVAALGLVLTVLGTFLVLGYLVGNRFADQFPLLLDSAEEGLRELEQQVAGLLPDALPPLDELFSRAVDAVGSGGAGAGVLSSATGFLRSAVELGAGALLLLVVVFFVLKDGARLWHGVADLAPERHRRGVDLLGAQLWWTLGSYFRGQLAIAVFDAFFIGVGLLLLGVPLALPLAAVVLVGGLFPVVGAFVSGLLAVLVALADQGPGTALLVLGLVVLVQQVEGNVFEPLIMSKALALHPLVVLLVVAGGASAFGILGAFLAVPLWACGARAVDFARGRRPPAGPLAEQDAAPYPQSDPRDADDRAAEPSGAGHA